MGTRDLVRAVARRTVKDLRDRALTRISVALERRGMVTPVRSDPAPPAEQMVERSPDLWAPSPPSLPGLNLHADRQLELLERMRTVARNLPLLEGPNQYSLHLLARVVRPQKVVSLGEVDTRALGDRPERLEPDRLADLAPGDLLVVAPGAQNQRLLFDLLPAVGAGVWVVLSDVRYPFEASKSVTRAFLMYNEAFQIRFWASYLYQHYRSQLETLPALAGDQRTLVVRRVG